MSTRTKSQGKFFIGLAALLLLQAACSPPATPEPKRPPAREASSVDCEHIILSNPAAGYCSLMGYTYEYRESGGVCKFPDGSSCPQWEFYAGKCGQDFSYCTVNGYGIITGAGGGDPYSSEYSVCVDSQGKALGSVTDLIGLTDALDSCR
jgi:putative hemolysin